MKKPTINQYWKSKTVKKELGVLAACGATLLAVKEQAITAAAVAAWGPVGGIAVAMLGIYLRRKTDRALADK